MNVAEHGDFRRSERAESVVWRGAHHLDSGVEDYSVEAVVGKVFAGEALQRSADEALQIAGSGFMRESPYVQITRNCRIFSIFEGTDGVLRLYIALSGATGVACGRILSTLPQLLRESAGIYQRYAVELAETADFLLREYGKSIADQQHGRRQEARMANNRRRAERNEDEEMSQLAGFIADKGSYPWDVVS